jgi:diaminohydroxyphosphoribosylaminopyrimidine deaminase/5-amino-6-(5-phosphoribosylamino)uracil reductase
LSEPSSQVFSAHDTQLMRRVMGLAECGKFTVSPNPRVGCVITKSQSNESKIIGEGYHQRKGEAHAERVAFSNCSEDPSGGTLYVNLEPCCHFGATPPCTDAIIEAGIKRVVISTLDPFKHVSGKGVDLLRQHGIQVDVGLLADEAEHINRFFFHTCRTGLPWVMIKAAVSLDGKMATATGDSKWITGGDARKHVHELRAEYDAILVGANTVRVDDPSLNVRLDHFSDGTYKPTVRVVLDKTASISLDSKLVQSAKDIPVLVFVGGNAPVEKTKTLCDNGVEVFVVSTQNNVLNLMEVLKEFSSRHILSLMIEGGATVHTSFLEAGLVNEVNIYTAPVLIGGTNSPSLLMGMGKDRIEIAERLTNITRIDFGSDILTNGILRHSLG